MQDTCAGGTLPPGQSGFKPWAAQLLERKPGDGLDYPDGRKLGFGVMGRKFTRRQLLYLTIVSFVIVIAVVLIVCLAIFIPRAGDGKGYSGSLGPAKPADATAEGKGAYVECMKSLGAADRSMCGWRQGGDAPYGSG